jgi:hypothetical protein
MLLALVPGWRQKKNPDKRIFLFSLFLIQLFHINRNTERRSVSDDFLLFLPFYTIIKGFSTRRDAPRMARVGMLYLHA